MYKRTIVLDSCVVYNQDILDAVCYIQKKYKNIEVYLVKTLNSDEDVIFNLIDSISDILDEGEIDKSFTLITCSEDNYKKWIRNNGKGVICSKKGTKFSSDCIYLRNYDKIKIGRDIKKIIHLK